MTEKTADSDEQSDEQPDVQLGDFLKDVGEDTDVTGNLAMFPDDPPRSGQWVDADDAIAEAAEEEFDEGQRLGEAIDPDDDDDTGLAGDEDGDDNEGEDDDG